MFVDADGNELTYWPVGPLVEDEDSDVIVVGHEAFTGAQLRSTTDDNAAVMARLSGTADPYQDIGVTPIAFGHLTGLVEFDVYIHANTPLVGFNTVPLSVGSLSGSPAGWAA